jgi:hypothetical protein
MSQITPLPTPVPESTDPANFDARADAFLGALPTFASEVNNLATELNSMANQFTGLYSLYPANNVATSYTPTSSSLNITIQTNKGFTAGMPYTFYANGSPATHYMTGIITSYNASTGAIVLTRLTSLGASRSDVWILTVQGTFPIITTTGSTLYLLNNFGIF